MKLVEKRRKKKEMAGAAVNLTQLIGGWQKVGERQVAGNRRTGKKKGYTSRSGGERSFHLVKSLRIRF
jgi:hypothetical protein